MSEKYVVHLCAQDKNERNPYTEILDYADLPLRLGKHLLMEVVTTTPQGPKRLRISVEVSKYL